MGYIGIKDWTDSDDAVTLTDDVLTLVCKRLNKELKVKGNEFNLDGVVNVALFLESFVIPNKEYTHIYVPELSNLLSNVVDKLINLIEKTQSEVWTDNAGKKKHLTAYRRLHQKIEKFYNSCDC